MKCKYCGFDASRQSDEDCPAKFTNKVISALEKLFGWIITTLKENFQ